MRALLIEAQNGISGDMFVAAAAALAGCEAEITALPGRLGLRDVRCSFHNGVRSTLQCRHFVVTQGDGPEEAPDHPHGHHHHAPDDHHHDHGDHHHAHDDHHHDHGGHHHHDHAHGPGDDSHHHEHRSLPTIQKMIRDADLDRAVCDRALRMFERLGAVEAAAHGIPVEQVHFHEVGAVDSILDVVAAALCIERLNIAATYATPVCVGSGSVRTAHGQLPVPAPATEKLLQGMPTVVGDLPGEWTTPTGALILDELQPKFSIPILVTRASTLGGGTRNPPGRPNVLRLRLGETTASSKGALQRDELCAILANIDDASGEMLGADLIDMLLRAGARDALIHPVIMKRGRPAHQLEVLVEPHEAEKLAEIILTHTSTIGVRMIPVHRLMLPREALTVATAYGEIAAKRVTLPGGARRVMPEYESCREAASRAGVPVQDVYRSALGGANP